MSPHRVLSFALALLAGCSSSSTATVEVTLDDLVFRVPVGWDAKDLSSRQRRLIRWTPNEGEMEASLAIIRTDERASFAGSNLHQIAQYLENAQRALPGARFSAPKHFVTGRGLTGIRVDGEVRSTSEATPQRRAHAIVLDRGRLLHVIYQARDFDADVIDAVLDNIARKGA